VASSVFLRYLPECDFGFLGDLLSRIEGRTFIPAYFFVRLLGVLIEKFVFLSFPTLTEIKLTVNQLLLTIPLR
jgi:hypothetical protein